MNQRLRIHWRGRVQSRHVPGGRLWWAAALAAAQASVSAQVVLNEVLADNQSAVEIAAQFPDYVELINLSGQPAVLDGMSLTDDPVVPRKFVFPAGTSLPSGDRLVVWCGGVAALPGLHANFALGAAGERVRLYAADGFSIRDEIVFGLQVPDLSLARIPEGTGPWTLAVATAGTANVPQPMATPQGLRINEWMARPSSGEDWIEVFNGESLPAPLSGLILTDRTTALPANRPIPAHSYIGSRGHALFFASDLSSPDANHLDFRLSADGEILTLYRPDRATQIDRVQFGAQSTGVSQGRSPDGGDRFVFFTGLQITPGEANFKELTAIVISEILTHTDPPLEDAIELHNTTSAPVDISHWWLSDEASSPKKFRIPPGTLVGAGGFTVIYEYQFGAGPEGFHLSSYQDEQVVLSAGDAAGNLTGPQTFLDFGPLKNGISVGRHPTSLGVDYAPMSQRTLGRDNPSTLTDFRRGGGLPNALPRVGPVVVSELMVQPSSSTGLAGLEHEFLELHNPGSSPVQLYDADYPTNSWRVRGGLSFNLPLNLTLPPQGYLVIVGFHPTLETAKADAFRAAYDIPSHVPIVGPFIGQLNNAGEEIQLLWPDKPEALDSEAPGLVPFESLERVHYETAAPWPAGAAGTGWSLHRSNLAAYGNDPAHWSADTPTPGRAFQANDDTDNDGMPDSWELTHNLNLTSPADATTDLDFDGTTNLDEYRAGTHPRDSQSAFAIHSVQKTPTGARLVFHGVAGRAYTVEFKPDGQSWQTVAQLVAAPDTQPREALVPTPASSGFYRISTPSP